MTEFILPPPHPSVKERDPRGALSYDQILFVMMMMKMDFIQKRQRAKKGSHFTTLVKWCVPPKNLPGNLICCKIQHTRERVFPSARR